MLVDHAQPVAYCVAGPHPTVILTTAVLRALDPDQVDAVLAHERAHLASHHHRLLAIARIGRQVLPFIPATTDAVQRIQRLLRPAEPLSRLRRQLLGAGAAVLALTPLLLALTPAIVAVALGHVPVA
jgi:Zn-dependent protease with chaperone function